MKADPAIEALKEIPIETKKGRDFGIFFNNSWIGSISVH